MNTYNFRDIFMKPAVRYNIQNEDVSDAEFTMVHTNPAFKQNIDIGMPEPKENWTIGVDIGLERDRTVAMIFNYIMGV